MQTFNIYDNDQLIGRALCKINQAGKLILISAAFCGRGQGKLTFLPA